MPWSVIQLDAAGNIQRVHYKGIKCDVSLSLGSVSTLGEVEIFVMYFFLLTTMQKL